MVLNDRGIIMVPKETQNLNIVKARCRATIHVAEDVAAKHASKNWLHSQCHRQWMLAGKVAIAEDGRWSNRILGWKPWFRSLSCRPVGQPCERWDDNITQLAGGGWVQSARDSGLWTLSYGFIHFKQ